jgi:iron-sulfur cluster assembly accessory protein
MAGCCSGSESKSQTDTISKLAKAALMIDDSLHVTESAAKKISSFIQSEGLDASELGLRVRVQGGGCSGFFYEMELDRPCESDRVFAIGESRVIVDAESLEYLAGSSIDYVESVQGSGFTISNPNVSHSCGCGNSFAV